MLVDFLQKTLAERIRKNSRYSLRAFAKSLETHPATLSNVLSKSRTLTPRAAERLLRNVDVSAAIRQKLLFSTLSKTSKISDRSYKLLDGEAFEMIAAWEHFALLALLDTRGANQSHRYLAKRLGISPNQTLDALKRLQRLNLVTELKGIWSSTGQALTTQTDVPNAILKKANRECIEKALKSLDQDEVNVREVSGITLAIDPKKLKLAKLRIAEFRREMAELLETDHQTEVYRLNIQLFPFTKKQRELSS